MDLVVFPDAVQLTVDYLRPHLAVAVGARVPSPRPSTWVTVSRAGGTQRNIVVDDPIVVVDAWYVGSWERAHDLSQTARAWLHVAPGQFVGAAFVYRVDELAGPYENPDPISEVPRYTFSVQISLRGAVVPAS